MRGRLPPATSLSATRACSTAKAIVGVLSAWDDTIGADERDAIQDDQPDVGDVTADIVGAPLRWTMTPAIVTVGLGDHARRVRIWCLDTNRMGPKTHGHNRHVEFRQHRGSDQSSYEPQVAAPQATLVADRGAVARPANRRGPHGGAFA